ncbi:hypothetical protein [Simplicispira metamorpha]|uniref:Uncharacterized protein n=1 Tax=Simplicispira metamorpha TaxID=80881 RepID=A0A4R2N431_9BURK|nr:hypothetical protein [Simplicispira metamorpha]TCP15072.1 hypothetical protein EV674_12670 [Simplicispira metamorpha]
MTAPTPNDLRAQVLALRRTQSARAVAQALNIPLGTVKAISSRAGITRDNTTLRAFFRLPEIVASDCTALQPPVAPPQPVAVTGNKDLDAVLWLRQVVQTGDAALIAKAMQAAERIKTPVKELEKRYGDFLMRESGGNTMRAVFGSIGFADLKGLAERTLDKQARKREALARFGSEQAVFAENVQERFCVDALALVPVATKGWREYDPAQANAAFDHHQDMAPHTLADCLHELEFWDALYHLRNGWDNAGDDLPEVSARRHYIEAHCLASIRPKTRDEAKAVLRYMAAHEMFDRNETDAVLENLVG